MTSFSPLTEALEEIRKLTNSAPKTLTAAKETFQRIERLGETKLREYASADLTSKITSAAQSGVYGENRIRTLPQAEEKLAAIAALIPAACTEQTSTATPTAHPAASIARSRPAPASSTAQAQAVTSDSLIYDRYESLKGAERQAFFAANRDALVREHTRRAGAAGAAAESVHSGLVEQYMSLTGRARSDFFDKHQRELFEAYRARSKHGR